MEGGGNYSQVFYLNFATKHDKDFKKINKFRIRYITM